MHATVLYLFSRSSALFYSPHSSAATWSKSFDFSSLDNLLHFLHHPDFFYGLPSVLGSATICSIIRRSLPSLKLQIGRCDFLGSVVYGTKTILNSSTNRSLRPFQSSHLKIGRRNEMLMAVTRLKVLKQPAKSHKPQSF